jgi:SAM-dependent methyltransferase
MPDTSYDQVPYLTVPMAQTHPDRLASVATLFGMKPQPVTACRALEIGCGAGGNLIPMAYFLPGSHFRGVDLAEAAVAEGRRSADEVGLSNVELIAMDLCDIGPEMGEFDYIIAHGLYSWIPDPVRDRLLAICRERLTPNGIASISYNALPGRHVRMMLREMMMYHTRDSHDAGDRIQRARELLQMVGSARLASSAWQPMIDEEIQRLSAGNPGWFFHDDLAPVNDSFYFRDFVARAARNSLQYLGDAEAHLMFDVKNALTWLGDDVIEREQYLDFLCFRQFRQTLLCHAEAPLERPARPERMDQFLFSSPARQSEGQIEGMNSVCITEAPAAVARVAAAMGQTYPLPVAFDKLAEHVSDRDALRGILFTLIRSGFAEFHVNDPAADRTPGARPRVSRLARWESERTGVVTYSTHTVLKLDPMARALIELLDGTRDLDSIASALTEVVGAPSLDEIRARLPDILTHMAKTGLLEG